MRNVLFLFLALIFEIIVTSVIKKSEEFTKSLTIIITIIEYYGAFYCLSCAIRTISVGFAYAIWSGVGIVLLLLSVLFSSKKYQIYEQLSVWL